jgi:hypothetical protein
MIMLLMVGQVTYLWVVEGIPVVLVVALLEKLILEHLVVVFHQGVTIQDTTLLEVVAQVGQVCQEEVVHASCP